MFNFSYEELKEKWKHLVFSNVTRVIVRASDLSLWYTPPSTQPIPAISSNSNRIYLGDNKCILDKLTGAQQANVSWEYDYFFGFCRPLFVSASAASGTYLAGKSIHFSSNNHSRLDLLNANCEWSKEIDPSCDSIVRPPHIGDMMCGITKETEKGCSFEKWFACPCAFYELWKLIMRPPSTGNITSQFMRQCLVKLEGPPGPMRHIYQAIALVVVFKMCIPPALKLQLPHFYVNDEIVCFI